MITWLLGDPNPAVVDKVAARGGVRHTLMRSGNRAGCGVGLAPGTHHRLASLSGPR